MGGRQVAIVFGDVKRIGITAILQLVFLVGMNLNLSASFQVPHSIVVEISLQLVTIVQLVQGP